MVTVQKLTPKQAEEVDSSVTRITFQEVSGPKIHVDLTQDQLSEIADAVAFAQ
jgi:hypothetical protein